MRQRIAVVLVITVCSVLISTACILSQTETDAVFEPNLETSTEPEILWLWGEVISVDIPRNQVLVKYFDYEADQEKEITINVDEKTTYENINSILDIRPESSLSIDYIVTADGKNIAKNISVDIEPSGPAVQP